MKKYYTILLLLILSSCDSFFREVDDSYQKIDTQQEKVDMINGIYARLVQVHDGNYLSILSRSDDVNVYQDYKYSGNGMTCISSSILSYPEIIGNIYVNLYAAIININNLLGVLSERNDKKLLGELYFIRAYCYFKLERLFGTPPLVEDIVVNYYLKKPTYREVYEFIESDLLKALKLLPNNYTDARIPGETPHIGTAKALLAEVYLTMAGYPVKDESKYAEAARLAGEVIVQANKYNFALQPDFAALWREENKHDKENIFGLFFSSGSDNTWNKIGNTSLSGPDFKINLYRPPSPTPQPLKKNVSFFLQSQYVPEFRFFDDFPENYRKLNSFILGAYNNIFYETQDTTIYSLQFTRFNYLLDPCAIIKYGGSLKWVGDYQKYPDAQRPLKTTNTLYLLRYAQTLLTYAEAKARSGKLDQSAYEAVNKIRRRANHLDLNTPSKYDLTANLTTEQFLDSVVWERAWELSFEPDGRWFDIIRLDLKDKLAGYRYPVDKPTIVPDKYLTNEWYFYQIPEEDRWANPNFR